MPRRLQINYYNQFHVWALDPSGQRKVHAADTKADAEHYLRTSAQDFFAQGGYTPEIHDGYGDIVFAVNGLEELQ